MKRILSLFLGVAMLLTLAACAGDPSSSQSSVSPTASGSEPSQSGGDPEGTQASPDEGDITSWILEDDTSLSGTVRFWIPFKGDQGMDDMIAEFNEIYPNIEVVLTTYSNTEDGNLSANAAIMSGEVDVLSSFSIQNTYNRWENGLFVDITDRVKEENIDLIANWGSDVYTYNDRIYTFPNGGRSTYVAINMTAWEEAGLGEIPTEWTWDEYLAACEAMTKRDDSGNVTVYGGSDYRDITYWAYCYSQVTGFGPFYDVDTGLSSFGNEIMLKGLSRKLKAELENQIWFPSSVMWSETIHSQTTYTNGQIATSLNNNLVRFLRDTENYPVDWVTAFAPWPLEEAGQTNYMSGISSFSHTGITTGCKDEAAAWAFLKWFSTYGSKYLTVAGHQGTWLGTDPEELLLLVFGTMENAEKIVDVDSFLNVVVNYDNPSFEDSTVTAYTEVQSALSEVMNIAIYGDMDAASALAQAQAEADQAIQAELG